MCICSVVVCAFGCVSVSGYACVLGERIGSFWVAVSEHVWLSVLRPLLPLVTPKAWPLQGCQ